jgi:transcriptional regulator with XRE-family HTH domain
MTSDYIVELRIRNGYMRKQMLAKGYYSNAELGRASGVDPSRVGDFMNLKAAPVKKSGGWAASIEKIAVVLRCFPEDLFPPQHLEQPLKKNRAELEMGLDQISAITTASPEVLLIAKDAQDFLADAIDSLENREAMAIREHFFNGMSKKEVAAKMPHRDGCNCWKCREKSGKGRGVGVSTNRVRQIMARGTRKLRRAVRGQDAANELIRDMRG